MIEPLSEIDTVVLAAIWRDDGTPPVIVTWRPGAWIELLRR